MIFQETLPETTSIHDRLQSGAVTLSGLSGGSKGFFLLAMALERRCPIAVVTAEDVEAEGLLADIEAWSNLLDPSDRPSLLLFPESDPAVRIASLGQWKQNTYAIVACSQAALGSPTYSPDQLKGLTLEIRPGRTYPRDQLLSLLAKGGYERTEMVEMEGEVAVRGEVVDVWPPGAEKPWRLLFDGDELESLRDFSSATQRSEAYLNPQKLLPMKESESQGTFKEHVPPHTLWFWDELDPESTAIGTMVYRGLGAPDAIDLRCKSTTGLASGIKMAAEEAHKRRLAGWSVLFFSHNSGESDRLTELLDEQLGSQSTRGLEFLTGPLRSGFMRQRAGGIALAEGGGQWAENSESGITTAHSPLPTAHGLFVLTNSEIFGRYRQRTRAPKYKGGQTIKEVRDIQAGDYVVHENHGIGRYRGLRLLTAGGQEAEYLELEYRGGKIYVPIAEFRQIQKYSGSEGKAPRLNSLDPEAWERVKQRVKEGVQDLAKDLVKIHATRAALPGYPFPPDNHLEQEFAASFLYEETADQLRAIADVKRDMESPRPMDRLILGDVGYGKTEVAMRAAFKAVVDSKQVGVLVPTTILAEQHYRTFKERFADYPARIGMLSRFQSPKDEKETLLGIANGTIDIVVGTHKLFQKEVVFKDIGLLIIDEEHRFGVKHKEQLKKMRKHLDVLTMTATPIPRTLSFAMAGLRELSVIETPPTGRLPITTHVGPYNDSVIRDAVRHELDRGGQVFYVHNRVQSIPSRLHFLQGLFPDLSIAVVHGQMTGPAIEKTMWEFTHRKHQILLATSIIESGIDIPTVNTLIVDEAEEFGLAQLYQLRGRVGRERQKAFCYLFYSPSVPLTADARARLEALREFTELGSGYHLAVRDMEIRGAGNLLGQEQHGFVAAVGLDLYAQLLQEEISTLKGEPVETATRFPSIDLSVRAFLPSDYLPSEELRIHFYKKLVSAANAAELEMVKSELEDRFGAIPPDASLLLDVSALRLIARDLGISSVMQKPSSLEIAFLENTPLQPGDLLKLGQERAHIRFKPGPPFILQIALAGYEANGPVHYLHDLFARWQGSLVRK